MQSLTRAIISPPGTSQHGGPLARLDFSRLKRTLLRWFPIIEEIFVFNRTSRDRWITSQARTVPPASVVLDIGAGSAPYRELFKHCSYRTHDFGQLEPEQLQGRMGYWPIDIVSDINDIPVPSGSLDLVLCTEVIEHVPEPIKAVREMARLLKPGGRLLLSAPLRSGLHQKPFHFYGGYTKYWYQKHLADAGFENIVTRPVGGLLKAYAEESIRIGMQFSPLSNGSLSRKLVLLPFWPVTFGWFGLLCPTIFSVLDRSVRNDDFTVGYHVEAIRAAS